jgi:archaeal type IV pilus assembly protein PilA
MMRRERESAVSEIIATVLIVALTVILAAIIGALLLGTMNGVDPTYAIALTASQPDSGHIIIVYDGGPDQKILSNLSIQWPTGTPQQIPLPKVGDAYIYTGSGITAGQDHVVVSATFANKRQQVVLDTYV